MSPIVVTGAASLLTTLMHVQRLFSMFPSGAPGVALCLLRLSVAVSCALDPEPRWLAGTAMVLLGLGIATPIVATAVAALHASLLLMAIVPPAPGIVAMTQALALALLGPGAYSFDAWRFGRRLVVTSEPPTTNE